MTIQEIITRARSLCYTNTVQYSDTQAIEDFNIIYRNMCNSITQEVNEDFFWDIFKTDTVVWQSEYSLPTTVFKISEVSIKESGEYKKAINTSLNSLPNDTDYYKINQSTTSPIYEIKDESIFIYPSPIEEITDWIKMRAIITPPLLPLWWTILIPDEYHYIIAQWMQGFIYKRRGKINEKNDAMIEYNWLKEEMLFTLSDRKNTPTNNSLPNLSFYA